MIEPSDPVQRHIYAIMVRDAIVRDDAADMTLVNPSQRQIDRQLRAMLPGVDFTGEPTAATLDDPPGRRIGRVAFNPVVRAGRTDGRWTGAGPAPHRLPDSEGAICRFILQQTHLGVDDDAVTSDLQIRRLLGFDVKDHPRNSEILRAHGPASRLFIAASMLSAACAKYERTRGRTEATGRNALCVEIAALSVEAALIGTARIATDILLADDKALPRVRRIAMHLTAQVEVFRRTRSFEHIAQAVRRAAAAADAVHLYLTRGTVNDLPHDHDRDPGRLRARLKVTNAGMEDAVQAMVGDVDAVDGDQLYVLLMARRLDVALARYPWLAAPHPIFRLNYAYIGGHALFAELERLGVIIKAMAGRQRFDDGTVLDTVTLRPVLGATHATYEALGSGSAPGRYLGLGVYHRAVTTSFIRNKAHWLSATVPSYTHHAYAIGSRFSNIATAALDTSTHDFMRSSELDKPTQLGTRRQGLVLFYGLDIEETVILALRQIFARVSTDDQADHRTSIDSQEAQIRADAEAQGQIVVRIFVDAGESGQDARRPEFNRLLEFVEDPANGIREIKIVSLSRLARNMETQVQTFARLKRAKVRLLSLTQTFSDDAMGGMFRNLIASFDEYFALETAKHTRRTMRANAMEGFYNGGPVPHGYESRTVEMRGTKAKKKLFIHEDNARTVRLMFTLATVGDGNGAMGARAIAEWLNERGYTLATGAKFNNSNVTGILGRTHYRGYYFDMTRDENGGIAPEDTWVRVECPQVIPDHTMDAVASLRATRRPTVTPPRVTNGPTLLTKVARCGLCGEGMTIRTGKGGRYAYYSCNAKVSSGAARCACPHTRQERLDGVVLGALETQIFEPERLKLLLSEMLEASAEADECRSRDLTQARLLKTQAETRLRNLYEALADGQASLKEPVFANMLAEANGRIASLTATVETLERQIGKKAKHVTPEIVEAFAALVLERLHGADPALRKAYVALFVSEVAIDHDQIRISGSTRMLERAVGKTEPAIMGMVPIFDRKWCATQY